MRSVSRTQTTLALFASLFLISGCADAAEPEVAHVLPYDDRFGLAYNQKGIFIGEFDPEGDLNFVIENFGDAKRSSPNEFCQDYIFVSWFSDLQTETMKCGAFEISVVNILSAQSYDANLICNSKKIDCSKIGFNGVAFQISVREGDLVSLTGLRRDGSTYQFVRRDFADQGS